MFANSMKILTLNTKNASPISAQSDSGTQPVNKVNNSSNHDENGGERAGSGTSNKTNKREQKNSNKNKFVHGNTNKMQQHMAQQHQQLQKFHNKNNNNGSKLKNQHYGNINSSNHNTSSSVNRKKYYQQPQHHQKQQQQQQQQHYQQQQQEKHITTMPKSTNSSQTATIITNNNNSNLVKNQNYNHTDLLSLQQQSNHQKYQKQQLNGVTNLEHLSKDLKEERTCLLQQDISDKLPQPSFSPDCSASATSVLLVKNSDCQANNICYDNRLKISSTSNKVQANEVDDLATNCDTNENLPKTTLIASPLPAAETSASLSIYADNQSELAVTKRKALSKNSNIRGGVNISIGTEVNRKLSSGYSSDSIIQSPKLSEDKQHQVWEKTFKTNSNKNFVSNTNINQSVNEKNCSKLAANCGPNQQSHILKQQIQTEDKTAMTTPLATSIEKSTSIKTSVSTSTQSPKTQQDILEKSNDTKQILKTFSNKNTDVDTNKTATTTSSSSSTSTSSLTSSNSYTLDFLHSVGVKMTDAASRSSEVQGTKNYYGNQTLANSSVRNTYSYTGMSTNQRQPRYMYSGSNTNSGNNGSQMQHYHHHHQPSQLTIASFLNKDLLGEDNTTSNTNSSSSSRGNSSSSNSRDTNVYQDRQQPPQYTQHQQHHQHNSTRYHQNYNAAAYQQQSVVMQQANYGGGGGVSGGHRSSSYSYTNYHNNSVGHGMAIKNNNMTHLHTRQLKNNITTYKNSVSNPQVNKKSSYPSSTTSSASLSSSKSVTSNSSNISNRHLQTSSNQESSTSSSNLNLAIETIPPKMPNGTNQRISNRGHHNSHHGHYHGNQHLMMHSPNVLQHQNYHNLTYVTTDGSACGAATSRGSSPALHSLQPTPLPQKKYNSPKSLDQSPGHATMLINFNANKLQYPRYQHAQILAAQQQQQYHPFQHQQQTNILSKKVFVPLSLNLLSPSPSPTLVSNSQHTTPHNTVVEASSPAATTVATSYSSSRIIAVNDYESDSSSNHSSTQKKYKSSKPLKSTISSSSASSSSTSSISLKPQQMQQSICAQSVTSATGTPPTVPMHSPIEFNYCGTTSQGFSNVQLGQQSQLPQFYNHNGGGGSTVISLLNLPAKAQNTFSDRQQISMSSTSNQRSTDQFNIAVGNHSNNSSGYWSPSFQNNHFVYHQFASTQTAVIPRNTSSSSSCGSSSASISPRLPNDNLQRRHKSSGLVVADLSSSSCPSSLNQQIGHILVGTNSNSDSGMILAGSSSSSISSSVSGYSNNGNDIDSVNSTNGEYISKKSSSQLLAPKKTRLTVNKACQSSSSSASSLCSSSASTLTSAVLLNDIGVENGVYNNNRCNSQLLPPSQASIASFVERSNSGYQNLPSTATQNYYSHYQSLPPPLPPHNFLYPQTHHIRALSTSSVHDFFSHTPPDRFLARAHLVEVKEAPVTLLNNSKWDHLSQDIWNKFINSQQTEETFKKKMRLWRYLYVLIKNAYPRLGVYLVGSTISGFGSDSSDVDMCLACRSPSTNEPRLEALFTLTILRDCLSKSGQFENFNLIEAKVPILRFRDTTHQLEVDLNYNNCVGIKNTHLLYCYSQLDWRLRPLVLVTKLWAQCHNINNAKNMTISSYSLVLMVIHFLQCAVNPPVLPCLHDIFPDKFPLLRSNDFGYVDMNETIGPYESKNTQTIGELFLMFLEYYSFFDYAQFAISVRTGGLLPINVCRLAKSIKNDVHHWKELCIEEPFDLTNTARSVYDFETFERVKAVFVTSWRILQETLDLNSIFSTILLPPSSETILHRNINSLINCPAAFNDVVSSGIKINYQPYVQDFRVSSAENEEYDETTLGYNNKDSAVDVDARFVKCVHVRI